MGIIISYLFYKKSISTGIKLLIISTMLFTNSLWCFYLPNLEKYTQRDLITYYKPLNLSHINEGGLALSII